MERPFVLLADENEATRTLMKALLQQNFNIDVTTSALESIERLKSRRYAAVVLDVLLPMNSGFDVLEYLQSNQPEMLARVVVVTAARTTEMKRARTFGVHAVQTKPFDIEELMRSVDQCTRHGGSTSPGTLISSGMILLLADVLSHRLM